MFAPPPSPQIQPYEIRPPAYTDPLQTLAQMGQLRLQGLQAQEAQLGLQTGQLGLQQKQMELESIRNMMQLYHDAGGDPDKMDQMAPSYGGILPGAMLQWKQTLATLAKERAETLHFGSQTAINNLTARDTLHDELHFAYQDAMDETDPNKQQAMLDQDNVELRRRGYPENELITRADQIPQAKNALTTQSWIKAEGERQAQALERRTKDLGVAASQAPSVTDQASLEALRSNVGPEARALLPTTYTPQTQQILRQLGIPAGEQVTQAQTAARDYLDAAYKQGLISKDIYVAKLQAVKDNPLGLLEMPPAPAIPQILPPGGAPPGALPTVTPPVTPGAAPPAPGPAVRPGPISGMPPATTLPPEPVVTVPTAPKGTVNVQDLAPAGKSIMVSPDGKQRVLSDDPALLRQGWTVAQDFVPKGTSLSQVLAGRATPVTGTAPAPAAKASPFPAPKVSAPAGTPPAQPAPNMTIGEAMRRGITGPALDPYIPAAIRPQINALVEGRVPFGPGAPRTGGMQEQLEAIAYARDPALSSLRYEARHRVLGEDAKTLQALNTIPLHIDAAMDAAEALKNFPILPRASEAWNKVATILGSTKVTDFDSLKTVVEDDLATALGTQTVSGIEALGKNLKNSGTPGQLQTALKAYLDAVYKRGTVFNERYHQANPTDPTFSVIVPSAQEVFNRRLNLNAPKTPATTEHHRIQVGNKQYQYKGSGDTRDLNNYTAVNP